MSALRVSMNVLNMWPRLLRVRATLQGTGNKIYAETLQVGFPAVLVTKRPRLTPGSREYATSNRVPPDSSPRLSEPAV